MSLKMKRSYPYTERHPTLQKPCDVTFDHKMNKLNLVTVEVKLAAYECLVVTAKIFLGAARMFDRPDADLANMIDSLSRALGAKSFSLFTKQDIQTFVDRYRNQIDWARDEHTPEAGLVSSAMSLADAIEDFLNKRYEDCHSNTVRCRASITWAER